MKLIVLEINEISKKIIDVYLSRNKTKGFDRLNKRIKTFVTDLDEQSIYPSQTWASINTGKALALIRLNGFLKN